MKKTTIPQIFQGRLDSNNEVQYPQKTIADEGYYLEFIDWDKILQGDKLWELP